MAKKQHQKTSHQVKPSKKKAAKPTPVAASRRPAQQADISYFAKMLLFFMLGTLWVRLIDINIGPLAHISLPAGLVIGLVLASHERLQIDRKLEYIVLIAATFISFYLPVGVTL